MTTGGFGGNIDPGDRFGVRLANLGDVDGDGINDIAAGAPFDDDGAANIGAVYILFMNADGTVRDERKLSGIDVFGGDTPSSLAVSEPVRFGSALAGLGDLDGDGVPDLAVGAPGERPLPIDSEVGSVRILFLDPDGSVKRGVRITEGEGGFLGQLDAFGQFGTGLDNLGDVDGDGNIDLAVSGTDVLIGSERRGAVWILLLTEQGEVKLDRRFTTDDLGVSNIDANNSQEFGNDIAALGDLDGNGSIEIAVGAPFRLPAAFAGVQRVGSVSVLSVDSKATVTNLTEFPQAGGPLEAQLSLPSGFGTGLGSIDDIDGDGVTDLAVGTAFDSVSADQDGSIWAMTLNPDGSVKAARQIGLGLSGFVGPLGAEARFGGGIADLGDLDGDGFPEIGVGIGGFTRNQLNETPATQGAFFVLELDDCETPPRITQQPTPAAQIATFGDTVHLSVAAEGDGALTYLWRRDGTPLMDGDEVTGSTTPMLSLTASAATEGVYDVVISNGFGDAMSDPAVLGVRGVGDAGCNDADIALPAGILDGADVNAFITSFGAGCP